MNRHPKESQWVDFLFGLCHPRRTRRLERHLARCPDCRGQLERLRTHFASLDTLRDPVEAPERLITDTLRAIRQSEPTPKRTWQQIAWATSGIVAAAAAVVLLVYSGRLNIERAGTARYAGAPETPTAAPEALLAKTETTPALAIGSDAAESSQPPIDLVDMTMGGAPAPVPDVPLKENKEERDGQIPTLLAGRTRRLGAPMMTAGSPPDSVLGGPVPQESFARKGIEEVTASSERITLRHAMGSGIGAGRQESPAKTVPFDLAWIVLAPDGVRVAIEPASDPNKSEGKDRRRWNIRVSNHGNQPEIVELATHIQTEGGAVTTSDSTVQVRSDGTRTTVTLSIPAISTKIFSVELAGPQQP